MNKNDIKVLIVEDELAIAKDIELKLLELGYTVSAIVDNGLDAINYTARNLPDLVLMDIVLPGAMDGIQAVAAIQNLYDIPVIYLTAYSDQVFLDRAKITDPMAYIIKPISVRELHAAITIALYKADVEKQLREKEFMDATLISLKDALFAWDSKGRLIRVNTALLSLLQCQETDVIGQDVIDVITLTDAETGEAATCKLIYLIEFHGTLKDNQDLLLKCSNNRQVAVRVSGSKIMDNQNQCLGYAMLLRDDTERKQQQQIIRESEIRFSELVNNIESIFYLGDIHNEQLIYISPIYEKIYGRMPAEVPLSSELPFLNYVLPDDLNKATGFIKLIHQQKKCDETFRITRPDGEVRWVKARCFPVTDKDSNVSRMACVIDDVTENTQVEIKLKQAAKVFENTSEGILITDADLNIMAVNQAFTQITGFTEQDVLGETSRILQSGEQSRSFYKAMWHTIDSTGHWQGEMINRRKNGEVYPQWMTVNTIHDPDANIMNYICIFSDITHIKKSQEKLDYLAHHDHLTGLANRLLFNARLEHSIERAARDNEQVTVVLMDLDRFKEINDSLGHSAGDKLLKSLGNRLRDCFREEDTLARLGGDEFIFILEELKHQDEVLSIAQKIQNIFSEPFLVDFREIIVTASLGISIYPGDGKDVQTLIKHADIAMYHAKQQGKNRIVFYTESLNSDNIKRLTLATQMRQALERQEFIVYYQPQICLDTLEITGVEALIRWQHPINGFMSPLGFIPLAEETGFIEELGKFVMHTACEQCKLWHDQGYSKLSMAVNLSAQQFLHTDIVDTVKTVLADTGLPASSLVLEITESGLMDYADKVIDLLDRLKSLGVQLAIDDFGTGYSSLSYLKRFPIDKLKIDQSFVKDLPEDTQDAAISRSIIALGKTLNLQIIAEGVETEEQRQFMISEGCHVMQGFLFSQPVSAEKLTAMLKST